MAGLLPSKPDIDPSDEPRVVGLDSDAADELIDALSSTTTREVLAALHEEPAAASALAERVDTSLQNVQYHLRKLEDAGLVEVGDTVYSEKGREMNVYVPADRALVVVAGREEETTGVKAALSRLLGGVGVLGVASVLVDRLARRGLSVGLGSAGGGGGADGGAAPAQAPETEAAGDAGTSASVGDAATETETPTATEITTQPPTDGGGFNIAEATTTTTGPTEASTPAGTAAETVSTAEPATAATQTPTELAGTAGTTTPLPTAGSTPTPAPIATRTATEIPQADLTTTVETAAAAQPSVVDGLAASPGLVFFLGGATVLFGGFALWWVTR
ncbi:ArsR/SmtB family transcription factor [Salinigranum marinum]|uniref:ArsR/SmtB family transcription factor n=1 Tax=Salinigranum marinum TaxID=1515595 RepID=UPI002989EE01|nr:helix-turn-helix domain-containing protein [Salinigranum marinum]